jgi:hypothetical protein
MSLGRKNMKKGMRKKGKVGKQPRKRKDKGKFVLKVKQMPKG